MNTMDYGTRKVHAEESAQVTQQTSVDIVNDGDKDFAKRVLRKIDWRLIPLMFITYNLNFMDKTILSSASVFGLREDNVSTSVINRGSWITIEC